MIQMKRETPKKPMEENKAHHRAGGIIYKIDKQAVVKREHIKR